MSTREASGSISQRKGDEGEKLEAKNTAEKVRGEAEGPRGEGGRRWDFFEPVRWGKGPGRESGGVRVTDEATWVHKLV